MAYSDSKKAEQHSNIEDQLRDRLINQTVVLLAVIGSVLSIAENYGKFKKF